MIKYIGSIASTAQGRKRRSCKYCALWPRPLESKRYIVYENIYNKMIEIKYVFIMRAPRHNVKVCNNITYSIDILLINVKTL